MKTIATLLVGSALAFSVNASTVSFNFSNPLATTEINQTGSLGLFDSTLGTLTGATIQVNGAAVISFGGTNNAAQAQRATLTSSVDLFWSSSLAALNPFLTDSILMSATSGSQSYAVGETKSFGPFSVNGFNDDNLASILGSLQNSGGGLFNVSCESASGLAVLGGGGNIATTQATKAGCGASIEYTYDIQVTRVPEPASMALVGLGMLGLIASRRRTKKA